jgi:hypothetical protein
MFNRRTFGLFGTIALGALLASPAMAKCNITRTGTVDVIGNAFGGDVGGGGFSHGADFTAVRQQRRFRHAAAYGLQVPQRQGRAESFEGIAEMLALPDVVMGPDAAADPAAQSRRYKRAMVVVNALRGVAFLVDAGAKDVPDRIESLVESLARDPVAEVRSSAAAILLKLRRGSPAGER